jgi:nucleoside-diphosphate-sugar epimerase
VADHVRALLPQADISFGSGTEMLDDWQGRFDISAARRDLGYEPRHTLESGIRTTIDHLRHGPVPAAR